MSEKAVVQAIGRGLWEGVQTRRFHQASDILDVLIAAVCLVLTIPLLMACAILIRRADGGPVFFTQVRLGKDGVPFRMYKLRTMCVDAEARTGGIWAQENDPRVLPRCRWMRISHVDELPQLINVLKGHMAIVGPRPEREEILVQLEEMYPAIRERLAVLPGITGLAQIRDGYDTTALGFSDKLSSDLEYIRRKGIAFDLGILFRTLPCICDRQAR